VRSHRPTVMNSSVSRLVTTVSAIAISRCFLIILGSSLAVSPMVDAALLIFAEVRILAIPPVAGWEP